MHADVNMDAYEGEDERTHKKRKHSNGSYTMHASENPLGEDTAKSAASTTPKRVAGRGHGRPNIEQFSSSSTYSIGISKQFLSSSRILEQFLSSSEGEDTFEQFYVLGSQARFEIVD